MAGYANDYSMSNNAKLAYANGSMPFSKWNKKLIIKELLIQFEDPCYNSKYLKESYDFLNNKEEFEKIINSISAKEIKKLLNKDGYHHTSKFYNVTNFYNVNLDIACDYIYQNLLED